MSAFYIRYPSAGGASSNPANGTNGSTAPTISTQVGGVGPDGNLHPISTDNSGVQNVNISTSVLPTGAATAANQVTGNNSLASIDSKLTAPLSVTGPLTDAQLRASAVPVSAASLPLPSGAATSALQTTGNSSLSSIDGKLGSLGQKTMAGSAPVVIASDQSALPISAGSLPLPTGAATEATLNAILVENSDFTASGNITTQNLVPGGVATAGSAVAISVANKGTVTIQVTGTYTGALSPQVTTDGTNWITQAFASLQNMATGASSATIPSASVGIWQIEVNGHAQFRITALAAVTGTAVISLRAADGTSQVSVQGVATAANQTTGNNSLASIDTKTPALGQAVMASSQPVVIASNQSAIPIQAEAGRSKVALARNDYGTTSVTTAAYVQLIASTAAATNLVEIFDSSGQTLVFAVGGAGSEVDQFYINPGGNGQVMISIPSGSRISIKAVTATASSGYINLNLYS